MSTGSEKFDAIRMQIMWHRLTAVVEEQAMALLRTAFSPIVRECGDLSAGVFDRKGRMLAQASTPWRPPSTISSGIFRWRR